MRLRSYDNLMIESYDRIKEGKHFDGNYQPYTKDFLDKMLFFFQEKEEYNHCQLIKSIIDLRFNHDFGFNSKIE